jgi:two-component system chemotaxis response regulator CheB
VTAKSLIVIGASAGGIEALTRLVAGLPPDLPAAVCVAVHIPSHSNSQLPKILSRAGPLPAQHARSQQPLEAGCIYVAPPDYHLLVVGGRLALSRGPRQNGSRPAIDPLFRTAARAFSLRAIGVVLSGMLDDGTVGLMTIKLRGGLSVVQDPRDALFEGMPRSALDHVDVDYVLPASEIGPVVAQEARKRAEGSAAAGAPGGDPMAGDFDDQAEAEIVANGKADIEHGNHSGDPSMFTCPDCGGVLWELNQGEVLRLRCHVGHAYSADSLDVEHADLLESALSTAVRALEESASLARRLAHRTRTENNLFAAAQFDERAAAQALRAGAVRQLLVAGDHSLRPGSLPRAQMADPTAGPRIVDDPNVGENGPERA